MCTGIVTRGRRRFFQRGGEKIEGGLYTNVFLTFFVVFVLLNISDFFRLKKCWLFFLFFTAVRSLTAMQLIMPVRWAKKRESLLHSAELHSR